MRRTWRLLRRAGCLLAALGGLAAWQLGCSSEDTDFTEGIRVDLLPIRDLAVQVTETSAAITWTSREAAGSAVDFGTSALDRMATGDGGTTDHAVTLESLTPDTTYRYRVRGLDLIYRFRTLGGTRSRIAFVSDRADGRREIYFSLDLGENVQRVTTTGGHSPALSRDGTRLAFVARGAGGLDDLFVATLDSDGVVPDSLVNLTNTADRAESRPDWSPDGARLAFAATPLNQRSRLILREVAGGTEVVLQDNGAVNDDPAWRPDGAQLAFVSTTRTATVALGRRPVTAGSLTVVLADGRRTPVAADEYALLSEADGLVDFSRGSLAELEVLISYRSGAETIVDERHGVPRPRLELFTIGADGTDLRRLTDSRDARGGPAYLADGRIVHSREGSTATALVTIPSSGGAERTLVNDSRRNRDPAVSPDGATVLYSSNRNVHRLINLWTVPAAGGEPLELVNDTSGDTQPAWAPLPPAGGDS